MEALDFAVVAAYLAVTLAWGARHARRAGSSSEQFFVAGRSLPWWLAGTSIVATTFAADTPLAIAGLVATGGIAGNWFWWADVFPAVIGALVVAHLWQRSRVLTDNELIELRYAGAPARGLRLFRALYFGVLRNAIVMGWVNLAMLKVLQSALDLPPGTEGWVLGGLFAFAVVYTLAAGLWGVVLTDALQFVLAMAGSITLAVLAVMSLGGIDGLLEALRASLGSDGVARTTTLIPPFDAGANEAFWAFVVYLFVKSWASGNTEGSGYVAQRILATRDERHARLAGLWYVVANFALRPWPWIAVGLVALVRFPGLDDPEQGYVRVMLAELPVGLRGAMIATLLAAFMSTIDTHLNWGASYLTHDVYRRFLRPDASERALVRCARLSIIALAAIGVGFTLAMDSIAGAWKFLASISAGAGLIGLLRWLWWRINAWSEISVMAASLVATNVLLFTTDIAFPFSLAIVVVVSVSVSFAVTFATQPEPAERLRAFYDRVRPPGWWGPVRAASSVAPPEAAWPIVVRVAGGTGAVYAWLFAGGWWLLGEPSSAVVAFGLGVLALLLALRGSRAAPSRT